MSQSPQRLEPFLLPPQPEPAPARPAARPELLAPKNSDLLAEDIELWRRKVRDLRAALKPLAQLALAAIPEGAPDDLPVLEIAGTSITLGDLRRAKRLYEASA